MGGGEGEIEGTGGAGGPGHTQQAGEYLYGTNHHDGRRLKIWATFCPTLGQANTRAPPRLAALPIGGPRIGGAELAAPKWRRTKWRRGRIGGAEMAAYELAAGTIGGAELTAPNWRRAEMAARQKYN